MTAGLPFTVFGVDPEGKVLFENGCWVSRGQHGLFIREPSHSNRLGERVEDCIVVEGGLVNQEAVVVADKIHDRAPSKREFGVFVHSDGEYLLRCSFSHTLAAYSAQHILLGLTLGIPCRVESTALAKLSAGDLQRQFNALSPGQVLLISRTHVLVFNPTAPARDIARRIQ